MLEQECGKNQNSHNSELEKIGNVNISFKVDIELIIFSEQYLS